MGRHPRLHLRAARASSAGGAARVPARAPPPTCRMTTRRKRSARRSALTRRRTARGATRTTTPVIVRSEARARAQARREARAGLPDPPPQVTRLLHLLTKTTVNMTNLSIVVVVELDSAYGPSHYDSNSIINPIDSQEIRLQKASASIRTIGRTFVVAPSSLGFRNLLKPN